MSEVGTAINEVRDDLALVASEFMADVCDLKAVTTVAGTHGGSTTSEATPASNVPCDYEPLKLPLERQIAGSGVTAGTHKLTLPSTPATQAIRPNYKIVVQANGDVPALTFEHPVILSDSLDPFVTLTASLKP